MLSELGRRPTIGVNEGSFADELDEVGLLLQEQSLREADDSENELNMFRSGSAPPTIEGSLSAVGGLFGNNAFTEFPVAKNGNVGNGVISEEELRSDPAYLSYYYSNGNLKPRLPLPLISKEEWRFEQRLKGASGNRRKDNEVDDDGSRSLFSMPPGFNSRKKENEARFEKTCGSTEWRGDGLSGLPGLGPGSKQKSLDEIFQDDLGCTGLPSHRINCNTFDENVEIVGSNESGAVQSGSNGNVGSASSYLYAAALGSPLSRCNTPDLQHVARVPSPCPHIRNGRVLNVENRTISNQNSFKGSSPNINRSADLTTALSGMNLSSNGLHDENHFPSQIEHNGENHWKNYPFGFQAGEDLIRQNSAASLGPQNVKASYSDFGKINGVVANLPNSSSDWHIEPQQFSSLTPNLYLKGSPAFNGGSNYQNIESANSSFSNFELSSRYSINPALASESQKLSRMGSQISGNSIQAPFIDPNYLQYLRTSEYAAAHHASLNYLGSSYNNLLELQKAYVGILAPPPKLQYGAPLSGKSSGSNHQGYIGNSAFAVGLSYPGSPVASPLLSNSPVGLGSPVRCNELNLHFPSGTRNLAEGMGVWNLDSRYTMDGSFASSLLEEFKSNKTRCFELSEISGHVVEFSTDQYGSRFIQQKLETATTEEKDMVYLEIIPHALALVTDVFGNYVIQKFFEHGLPSQRRELANKLFSRVLSLSLQMYGCRVIQKAIEVVELDQKIKMVEELDGHVMRCIRDQNGNHVIQKCIECVPEDSIGFIISNFFDQVATLSTHPYGCRVIQRVLEHCKDPKTQIKVMEEILGAVSMLAQDQYGNYVVQHVLEHGKSHERSIIIKELAGKIVQMSQQKFASNVVEKCLTFGGPAEHQLLVNEMLGTTDENEPLQAMMKDQFANYVVQKVLETCDDQQRELILSRIKVHLNALKKYTYGKHIVARVEKLVAAGERRIAAHSMHLASVT